ncbi:MAG: hypothetical protein R2939_07315 [Kofleriaceae bacterium]
MRSLLALVVVTTACGGTTAPAPSGPVEPVPAPAPLRCVVGGCSNTTCSSATEEAMITTCEWRDEYACYADATCEPQPDGACGWTPTEALTACLAAPPAA